MDVRLPHREVQLFEVVHTAGEGCLRKHFADNAHPCSLLCAVEFQCHEKNDST